MLQVVRFDSGSAGPAGVRLISPDGEVEVDSYLLMYVQGDGVVGRMAGRDRELVSMFASVARAAGGWAAVQGRADSLLALLAAAFVQGAAEAGGGRYGGGAQAQA